MNKVAFLIVGILIHFSGITQNRHWKTQTSKDGLVSVKSEVVDGKNEKGEGIKIMHYIAERTGKLTLEQAEKYLRNSENYNIIWESTLESREIKKISENEWRSYMLYSSIWPMPKSECIHHWTFIKNGTKGFKIEGKAIQDEDVKEKAERLSIFNVTFELEKVGSENVKLTLLVSNSPAINPPKFLMRTWFPEGPAGIVKRIFENAANLSIE